MNGARMASRDAKDATLQFLHGLREVRHDAREPLRTIIDVGSAACLGIFVGLAVAVWIGAEGLDAVSRKEGGT